MFARKRRVLTLFTRAFGAVLLVGACLAPALTTAAAQTPVVLKMARNAEPGIFIPWRKLYGRKSLNPKMWSACPCVTRITLTWAGSDTSTARAVQ